MPTKPHTQLGQKGKGAGRIKRRTRRTFKQNAKTPKPGPVPTQSPNVGQFPKMPPAPPNFLPNTPGFERAQRGLSDQLMGAQTSYSVGNQMVPAQLGVQTARMGTDRGYQVHGLNEQMADRGIFDSTVRPFLQQRDIEIPYGRGLQDLATGAAGQYADLASQFGGANLGYNQGMMEALLGRAGEAYGAMPLGLPIGGYEVPDQPLFNPVYPPRGAPKKKKKAGKKRPRRRGGRR